jgi:hypothetical protein
MIPAREYYLYLRLLDRATACGIQGDFVSGDHYLALGSAPRPDLPTGRPRLGQRTGDAVSPRP